MITICKGNIFDSECDALVNPVNCVGVMGAGLAKQFREHYPFSYYSYRSACIKNKVKPGVLMYCKNDKKCIILFPTKTHFKFPSKIEYIESGLDYFVENYRFLTVQGIKSFAFPLLGCGLGGLKKDEVLPLMLDKLKDCDCDIEIYT